MAQVYIPDDQKLRQQLEQPSRTPTPRKKTDEVEQVKRQFSGIDIILIVSIIATIALLVAAASRWTARLNPSVQISLSFSVLPAYAGYSLLRMILGYLLSLIFTLIYGHIAATNRRAGMVMVPLLDILQSIPILSFLPFVLLALVALFPNSNVGLELSSVILIFTSQAWNMTFSFYHSVRTQPKDLQEFSAVARLRPWQRFLKLELPSGMIGLIWNSMMSWSGGWFFLMASEQFTLGSHSFQLPGLGSYLQLAAYTNNTGALLAGLATLIVLIVLLDQIFWRPLVAWADKFKIELSSGDDAPQSLVLDALRRSALVAWLNHRIFRPIGSLLVIILNRLQPVPNSSVIEAAQRPVRRIPLRRVIALVFTLLLLVLVIAGIWSLIRLLIQVDLPTWGGLLLATFVTWLRTLAALLIGVAWTVPVGVAIGLSPRWSRRLQPVVQVVASIPATAVFPVLLGLLVALPGGLSLAAVLLMLLGTQWYILFNVIAGAIAIPSDLLEATDVYHVTRWRKWRTLILPAVFPYLVTGLLTASGGAWNASIVSEYVQFKGQTLSTIGLGASIASAANAGDYPKLLAGTLLMAIFVVTVNRLVWKRMYALAERRYTLE